MPVSLKFIPPLFGILAPREIITRLLPDLPDGYMPVVRGRGMTVVAQAARGITIENKGTRSAAYAVAFVNQAMVEKYAAVGQLFDSVVRLARK
jgi:hypothetical protein